MSAVPIRYRTPGQHSQVVHGLLVKETEARVYVILAEDSPHLRKLPISEKEHMTELTNGESASKAKAMIRRQAKRAGHRLSRECKEFLR